MSTIDKLRLDKWLWAARFYKTRSLAAEEIGKGRIEVNGQAAKPSRELKPGDLVDLKTPGAPTRSVQVIGLSAVRGPAASVHTLYRETPESIERRTDWAANRRLALEPALSIDGGRPTKRDRRQLADWDRWSASADR